MTGRINGSLVSALLIALSGCMLPKDADIVSSAVVAELAQTQNARPSEIVIGKVNRNANKAIQFCGSAIVNCPPGGRKK